MMKHYFVYMDNMELYSRIRNQYGNIKNFCDATGLNRKTVMGKLKGKVNWRKNDIQKIIDTMHLTRAETMRYFFTDSDEKSAAICRLAMLAEKMNDKQLALLMEIVELTTGKPALREFAQNWHGRIADLPAALRQVDQRSSSAQQTERNTNN